MSIRASLATLFFRMTIKKQMANLEDPATMRGAAGGPGGKTPEEVKTETVNAGGVPAEWVIWPAEGASAETPASEDSVLIYFHGGGYVFGSPDSHREIAWRLSQACGMRVLNVDYRLAPESIFPAAVEDATAVYRWILDQGVSPANIVLGGDSAGGGLATALMVNIKNLGLTQPAAALLMSPWVDLAMTGESMARNAGADPMLSPDAIKRFADFYLGDSDPRAPLASPLFADLANLPPVYVAVGSTEVLLSDSETLVEKINAAGGNATLRVWPKMPHVFPVFAGLIPEGKEAIASMAAFVKQHIGASHSA